MQDHGPLEDGHGSGFERTHTVTDDYKRGPRSPEPVESWVTGLASSVLGQSTRGEAFCRRSINSEASALVRPSGTSSPASRARVLT